MRTALVTLGAVLAFVAQVADAAPPATAAVVNPPLNPAATAASQVELPAVRATAKQRVESRVSSTSPSAAADNARVPGDVRPENPVVPQISLSLRRDRSAGAPNGGAIDDDAARCMARETAAERADCRTRSGVAGSSETASTTRQPPVRR